MSLPACPQLPAGPWSSSGKQERSFSQLMGDLSAERATVEEELRQLRLEIQALRAGGEAACHDVAHEMDWAQPGPQGPEDPTLAVSKLHHSGEAAAQFLDDKPPAMDLSDEKASSSEVLGTYQVAVVPLDASMLLAANGIVTDIQPPPNPEKIFQELRASHSQQLPDWRTRRLKTRQAEMQSVAELTLRQRILADEPLSTYGLDLNDSGQRSKNAGLRGRVCKFITWWPFDTFIAIVVMFDFFLLGLTIQRSLHPVHSTSPILMTTLTDKACTALYCVELALRYYAFGHHYCLRNGFVQLDTLLVAMALVDMVLQELAAANAEGLQFLGGITFLRILRVVRIARAARLTVHARTLWLLITGLGHSAPTMFWTLVMITGISYAFALLGMELFPPRDLNTDTEFNEVAVRHFGSLTAAMITLLQVLTWDSMADIYRPMITRGDMMFPVVLLYFVAYILFVSIALMNLVTAVMVEGAMEQASSDKAFMEKIEEDRKRRMFPEIKEMFATIDVDGSGELTLQELRTAPARLKRKLMEIVGCWDWSPEDIFQLIDYDGSDTLDVEEFLDGLLRCSQETGIQQFQMERLVRQVNFITHSLEDPSSAWNLRLHCSGSKRL
eukprot:TRINITY_DN11851_c0_g1_i1.p1 TRINITY_DN11851_c0_g1~~TRINITY_DN11851_c0_g1_i1.p1  ORF type:complete len:613 (-),score=90.25 TRINITY_DN11851_c0_g1_i1:261-2099(-)